MIIREEESDLESLEIEKTIQKKLAKEKIIMKKEIVNIRDQWIQRVDLLVKKAQEIDREAGIEDETKMDPQMNIIKTVRGLEITPKSPNVNQEKNLWIRLIKKLVIF